MSTGLFESVSMDSARTNSCASHGIELFRAKLDPKPIKHERAKKIANRIRAGSVSINGAQADFTAPFGGYKQSGNGREWGPFGFEEFLETKAVVGYSN